MSERENLRELARDIGERLANTPSGPLVERVKVYGRWREQPTSRGRLARALDGISERLAILDEDALPDTQEDRG